ncbi:allophycocyanin [Thermosynechococcaceae cyanobacterium BACA0444]|uniref:Allophycocyanin n=1 Tax=Pseudocalidococcus azoricus BACA0444 TaxID=2918990 RepID=A0AAE4K085_9CYAN|nr:allophycocyanin [Pseudocalidococcus azoricus]MDS3861687.1 allophycocyanin [Pseudocalidococcus azoricus BACA0444]
MFKQLTRLANEADGRFASPSELKFLKDYLETVETRMSAYSKVRDAETTITEELGATLQAQSPYIFQKGKQDHSAVCQRDRQHVLRISATSMLFGDLDSLREGFLLWYRTIINAFRDQKASQATYKVLPNIVNAHLTPEEAKLMQPALELDKSILGE